MPIEFACTCGKRLLARDDLAGRQGRCKACGAVYTIPRPQREEIVAVEVVDEPFPPLPAADPFAASGWNNFPPAAPNPLQTGYAPNPLQPGYAPNWPAGGYGAPQRLGQSQGGGLPSWLVPAVSIAGLFVLVVVGIGMLMMSGGSKPDDQVTAAPAADATPAATAAASGPTAAAKVEPVRSEPVAASRPGASSSWGASNASASSSQQEPAAEPAKSSALANWASSILGNSATEQEPWTLPALPGGYVSQVHIVLPNNAHDNLIYAAGLNPYVLVGAECYSLKTGDVVGKLTTAPQRHHSHPSALSPDGKHFAEVVDGPKLRLFSLEGGQQLQEISLEMPSSAGVKFMQFLSAEQLLTAHPAHTNLTLVQVWDVVTGKMVREFRTERISDANDMTINDEGKYLALADNQNVWVYDITQGKPVAQMQRPSRESMAFFSIDGLRFSPDGSELAAIAEHGNRLLCWNSQAKITVNHKLDGMSSWSGSFGYRGSQIEWAPNGKGWLLAGRLLVDRQSLRPLWALRGGWIHSGRARFLDADHIVATMGDSTNQRLTSLPIPWDKLNASLSALDSSAPAYLRPGQPISVQVKIGEVRHGDPEETKTELGKVAFEKMKQLGISVGSAKPLILLVYYTEKAGDQVAVYERRSRFDFRGTDTGQRVEDTKATIQISLWESGAKEPLWKGKLQAGSASSYKEDINEQTVRDSTFKNASNQLRGIMFPYFMPKDPNLVSLPAVTEL